MELLVLDLFGSAKDGVEDFWLAGFVRLMENLEKGTFLEKIRENLEN